MMPFPQQSLVGVSSGQNPDGPHALHNRLTLAVFLSDSYFLKPSQFRRNSAFLGGCATINFSECFPLQDKGEYQPLNDKTQSIGYERWHNVYDMQTTDSRWHILDFENLGSVLSLM